MQSPTKPSSVNSTNTIYSLPINNVKIQFPDLADSQTGTTENKETQTFLSGTIKLSEGDTIDTIDVEIGIVQIEITHTSVEWLQRNIDRINFLPCFIQFTFLNETVTTKVSALKQKNVYEFVHLFSAVDVKEFLDEIKNPTEFQLVINDPSQNILAKGMLNMKEIHKYPHNKLYNSISLEICLGEQSTLAKYVLFGRLLCSYQIQAPHEIIEKYFPRSRGIRMYSPTGSSIDQDDSGASLEAYEELDSLNNDKDNYRYSNYHHRHKTIGEEMEILEKKLIGKQSLTSNITYTSPKLNDSTSKASSKKYNETPRLTSDVKLTKQDIGDKIQNPLDQRDKYSIEDEKTLLTGEIKPKNFLLANIDKTLLAQSGSEKLKTINSESRILVPLTITIHHITLSEDSAVMRNDQIQQLYVEVHFLNFVSEEMESPNSVPKPRNSFAPMNFEFSVTFTFDSAKSPDIFEYLMKKSVSDESLKILLVSEPTHSDEFDCEEVGIFEMKYSTLFEYTEDIKHSVFSLYDANKPECKIGKILLSFIGISQLKRVLNTIANNI